MHRQIQQRRHQQPDQQADRANGQLTSASRLCRSLDSLEPACQPLPCDPADHPADGEREEDDDAERGVRVRRRSEVVNQIECTTRVNGTEHAQERQDDP